MPTFDFTSPEGKIYSVEGPEGATQAQAFDILQAQIGAAPAKQEAAPSVGVGEDLLGVAKSAPGRLLAGVAGLPGDLYHLGLQALGDKLTPESNYGSHAIRQGLGSDYEAQREPGKLAQKAVDFAPAVIGGPETLALKAATRVAAPAALSEVGREVAGPYGELAGALGGGIAAGSAAQKFKALAAAKAATKGAPSADDLLKTASGQFKQAEDMNLVVSPDWAKGAAQKMRDDLKGFDPEAQAAVFKAADRLDGLASTKAPALSQTQRLELEMNGLPLPEAKPLPVAMNEAELIRKQLVNLKQSNEAPVREAARRAIESLQESQLTVSPAQVLRGDAGAYTQTVKDAIGNWKYGKQSNTLMGKAALGDLNAATAGSGANDDNALRQAFKQLARPVNNDITPKWQRLGFDKDVGAGIEKVARGSPVGNAARYVGKLAPTGIVSGGLGGGAGFALAGPAGAVALPAVGYMAKKIGDLSTKKAVAAVDSLVRSRSPLAAQVAAQLPPHIIQQLPAKSQQILQSLVLARPAIGQQLGQPVGQPVAQ